MPYLGVNWQIAILTIVDVVLINIKTALVPILILWIYSIHSKTRNLYAFFGIPLEENIDLKRNYAVKEYLFKAKWLDFESQVPCIKLYIWIYIQVIYE